VIEKNNQQNSELDVGEKKLKLTCDVGQDDNIVYTVDVVRRAWTECYRDDVTDSVKHDVTES